MSDHTLKQKGISLYYQVETHIREKIESGEWALGSRLPTENELAQHFNVSRTTVRQAVDGMIEAGLLTRRQGSGTYVVKSPYARNRLNTQPSDTVCKYVYMPFLQDDLKRSYQNLLLTIIGHILMLHRQKLITREDGQELLRFILPLMDRHAYTIGSNPLNEDCFLNFEQYLISNLGLKLGSKILIARSRNDMTPTMMRMSVRDGLLVVYARLMALMRRILALAEENQGRVITGYTHWQPAQPITLDHYFLAIAEALERDFARLLNAYQRLNLSPLGSCAFAGTSYMIDREYTARLLGFDGIVANTLDAVASRDFLMELSADFSTLGSTIARFSQDLYLWSTAEFGYVSFSDSTSCCRSIMPQKKNPLSAEHIKSRTAHLSSAYMDIVMCLKGTVYSHSRDLFECMPPFWNCMEQMTSILELTLDMLHGIVFNYDRMERLADTNNSVLTDVSDFLERRGEFPFRSAHNIVALAISESAAKQRAGIALSDLNYISQKVYGHDTSITEEEWAALMSAHNSVSNKASEGSPSPGSCRKMFLSLRATVNRDGECLDQLLNSLQLSEQFRLEQINALMNSTAN